jgi:arabinose-5-phosphate isomerase
VALDCRVAEDACPLNLVPTASTTASLAIGDALAMMLLVEKGFRQEDFANLHPSGRGKRFRRVESLMHSGRHCPTVKPDTRMRDVIYEMSSKQLGMTCVVDGGAALLGIITDGDLRRQMERTSDVLTLAAADVMTRGPVTIARSTFVFEALEIMEQRKITSLVVLDNGSCRVAGVVHLHDLW